MDTYYAVKNDDGTECGCMPKETWDTTPHLQKDVDGKPMTIVSVIEAETWNEAMAKYHEVMGFEPYKPMED